MCACVFHDRIITIIIGGWNVDRSMNHYRVIDIVETGYVESIQDEIFPDLKWNSNETFQ